MAQYVGSGRRLQKKSNEQYFKTDQIQGGFGPVTEELPEIAMMREKGRKEQNTAMNRLSAFFTMVGETVNDCFVSMGRAVRKTYKMMFRKQDRRLKCFRKKAGIYTVRCIKKAGYVLTFPWIKACRMVRLVRNTLRQTRKYWFAYRAKAVASAVWQGLRNNAHAFKTFLNYVCPAAAIGVLAFVVYTTGNLKIPVMVEYNGKVVGYISDSAVAEDANQIVQGRMVYLDDSEQVTITPQFKVDVTKQAEILDKFELADKIIKDTNENITEAEGLYVDDTFLGAVSDRGEIETLLEEKLEQYKESAPDAEVSFAEDVKVVSGIYLNDNIIEKDQIVEKINKTSDEAEVYMVVEGDTAKTIADKNHIDLDTLKELNPDAGITDAQAELPAGTSLTVGEAEPLLAVQVEKVESYPVEVDYQTEVEASDKYYQGDKHVEVKGEKGQNQVTAKVTFINGEESTREIISTEVIKEPVNEKILEGTKAKEVPVPNKNENKAANNKKSGGSSAPASSGSTTVSGGRACPLPGYYVSSPYGGKRGHGGLDMCLRGGSNGATIYAYASGKVVQAGWCGTYGNLVRIDHGNGLETYYAHCSQINVSVGQQVSAGQGIAKVGSTGRSTGPHLHFEVRIRGARQNPSSYL